MSAPGSLSIALGLPEPPACELILLEDRSPPEDGFLRRKSRVLAVVTAAGEQSSAFTYDEVDRRAIDAVVVVPHFLQTAADGTQVRHVVLRSAHRPPVMLRDAARSPLVEPVNRALWELPAGLVEPNEASAEGIVRAAQRELWEETGFEVELEELVPLGPSAFPCPGVIAERHFFFHVEVSLARRVEPELDGSPLEAVGSLVAVPLTVALEAVRSGALADAKTELALRRLVETLS